MHTITNEIATEAVLEAASKVTESIYEIVSRGKSGFVKEGTGENGIPAQHLASSRTLLLEPISRVYLGAGRGFMKTQYIPGAPTIYVDDHYVDNDGNLVVDPVKNEAEAKTKGYTSKQGLTSLGYKVATPGDFGPEYKAVMERPIAFKFGRLDIGEYGDDPALRKFIKEHEQNINAPRAKDIRDPKRLSLWKFKALVPELEASKKPIVEKFDFDFEAMEFVSKLRTKTANGYKYNEEGLNAILAIVEDGQSLKAGEVVQKFERVVKWSRVNSQEFLDLVNGTYKDVKTNIEFAERFDVIKFTGTSIKFVSEGGAEILTVGPGEKEQQLEKLVTFFVGDSVGQVTYAEMNRRLEIAKLERAKQ